MTLTVPWIAGAPIADQPHAAAHGTGHLAEESTSIHQANSVLASLANHLALVPSTPRDIRARVR